MSQYCTQCGAENDNDSRFCKSCGLPLTRQTETRKQNPEQVEEPVEPIVSNAQQIPSVEPMKLSMLWIFPVLGMMYHLIFISYGLIMIETIAASLSAVVVILGIPLIITGIIRLIKKLNNTSYPNFVKHTFIGTIIMFFLMIAGNINTKMEESASSSISQSQNSGQKDYEDAAPSAE